MNRKEKIKVLQAIREGKLNPESLEPPQVYIFTERSDKTGIYVHNGKEYNETEYREFCKRIESKSKEGLKLHGGNQYPKEDIIILMNYSGKKFDDDGGQPLTLKID